WESIAIDDREPRSAVQRLLLGMFLGEKPEEVLRAQFSKRALAAVESQLESLDSFPSLGQQTIGGLPLEAESILDLVMSRAEFNQEGEAGVGYSISATTSGRGSHMFVVPEDDKYKIIGAPPGGMEIVGELVLELLEKNDIKSAQWWLDQAAKAADARSDGTGRPSIHSLWSGVTAASRGPNAIRIAANALIGEGNGRASTIQFLQNARAKAPLALDKAQIDKALCEALDKAGKWEELMAVAKRLQSFKTFSEEGFRYYIRGAASANKWKEMEAEAQRRFAENSSNTFAMRAQVVARIRQGDHAGAGELARKMTGATEAGLDEYLLAAWQEMLAGKPDTKSIERLKRGGEKASERPTYQLTLALLQAMTGSADDALQSLGLGMKPEVMQTISPLAWAAYGEICRQYGFQQEADAAFARMSPPKREDDDLFAWVAPMLKAKLEAN
ncbi:MAG TPA: hypothetical protein VIO38_01215, partial [Rariglobus sp.]